MKYITKALEDKGITQKDIIRDLGCSQPYASSLLNGKRNIGKKTAEKLRDLYGLDYDKLFLNVDYEPEKIHKPRIEAVPLHLASDPNDFDNDGSRFEDQGNGLLRMRIKVVPQKAYGSYFRGYQDPEYYEDLETISIDVHKEHQGNYLAFEVSGDSMITTDPNLFEHMALPGWKAISRELPRHHWKYKLHTHNYDTWVIVHKTEGVLIKSIIDQDIDQGTITIHSLNPDYPDEVLKLDDIAQIFSVVKYMIDKR